jgi:hypothetical protein
MFNAVNFLRKLKYWWKFSFPSPSFSLSFWYNVDSCVLGILSELKVIQHFVLLLLLLLLLLFPV